MHLWERAISYVDRFITEASRLFTSKVKPGKYIIIIIQFCRNTFSIIPTKFVIMNYYLDVSYIQFFGDDFLRLLLLRYVFCHVVLRHHRAFNVSL